MENTSQAWQLGWNTGRENLSRVCPIFCPCPKAAWDEGGFMPGKAFTLENMIFDPQLDDWELAVVGKH